jgi:hypothetical protein
VAEHYQLVGQRLVQATLLLGPGSGGPDRMSKQDLIRSTTELADDLEGYVRNQTRTAPGRTEPHVYAGEFLGHVVEEPKDVFAAEFMPRLALVKRDLDSYGVPDMEFTFYFENFVALHQMKWLADILRRRAAHLEG